MHCKKCQTYQALFTPTNLLILNHCLPGSDVTAGASHQVSKPKHTCCDITDGGGCGLMCNMLESQQHVLPISCLVCFIFTCDEHIRLHDYKIFNGKNVGHQTLLTHVWTNAKTSFWGVNWIQPSLIWCCFHQNSKTVSTDVHKQQTEISFNRSLKLVTQSKGVMILICGHSSVKSRNVLKVRHISNVTDATHCVTSVDL